jgi:FKBP-type peptidyl-prolyl cis-trans isomerase
MPIRTLRTLLLAAGLTALTALNPGVAQDPAAKKEVKVADPTLPALDAKEWKKRDSGLEIWDVKEGTGDATVKGATVTIHYTGWTVDGKIFDSSVKRGTPATFPLPNLIKGWQEGIPGMKAGGVRRLKIPYDQAYGEAGRPPSIPAKATLVFEIELFRDPMKLPALDAKEWKKEANGVRLWDVKEGTGDVVAKGATVTIHYTGWTLNGKVFDSSRSDNGKPVEFPLASLIKGWQEYVPGMKVGGVRLMELPPEFAYGKQGAGADIPPNSTLVFEIEVKGTKNK